MLKTYRQCSVCGGTGKLKEFRGYERDDECPQDCMYCPDDIHAKCRDRCLVLPAWVDSSPEQAIKLLASPLWAIITLKRLEYPDCRIRITDWAVEPLGEEVGEYDIKAVPEPKMAMNTDLAVALLCYTLLGQSMGDPSGRQ